MTDKKNPELETTRQYLLDHPDFLHHHPEVLTQLELPHDAGEAVSLIERQVIQLRDQNQKQSRQLRQLMRVAADNEALMSRLHEMTLELMSISDLGQFFDRLAEMLLDEFKADTIKITLIDRDPQAGKSTPLVSVAHDDAEFKQFQSYLDKGESACGRLSRNKLDFLFRQRAQWVQSTALVPLGHYGLLAIGSSDEARFYPGMGTLFLDLLARVVAHRLGHSEPEEKRRTA
jgi:uncharacterized protein YigA (DUF484 family)